MAGPVLQEFLHVLSGKLMLAFHEAKKKKKKKNQMNKFMGLSCSGFTVG